MKKHLLWIAAAGVLTGCGGGGSGGGESATSTQPSSTASTADAFVSRVMSIIGSTSDDAKPVPMESITVTKPEDTKPVPIS